MALHTKLKTKRKSKNVNAKGRAYAEWFRKHYAELLIISILVYAAFYAVATSVGPSYNGDDMAYASVALQIIHGTYHESTYIYTVRFLQIFPIAAFYLLGVGYLSSSAWNVLSFVITVGLVYLLGKELSGKNVGLVAALAFSFFPEVLNYTGTMSDDIPLMMFTSLTILCLMYAVRSNSKKWYFICGALLITPMLVTPLGFLIFPFVLVYLLIELLRKKLSINRTTLYFVYGIAASVVVLCAVNYLLSGNPLITFTLNFNYYSKPGVPGYGTLGALAGPNYYVNIIFPYDLTSFIYNLLVNHSISQISFWENNTVGLFFYAFAISAVYLILKRDRRAYVPLLWFGVMFAYLSIGPENLTFSPFSYTLMIRLDRYMMPLVASVVLTIAIAVARFVEDGRYHKDTLGRLAISIAALAFLVIMAVPLNTFWYQSKISQLSDQMQIANYISGLPNSTRIYYVNGLSQVIIFSGAVNYSRFQAYDQVSNCGSLPDGAYVVVPKNVEYYNLNYTPNPLPYCPGWKLAFSPKNEGNYSSDVVAQSYVFMADLYYIASNSIKNKK